MDHNLKITSKFSEVALYRCSYKKLLWKHEANLQENTHATVRF